jgi:hypothetical protein
MATVKKDKDGMFYTQYGTTTTEEKINNRSLQYVMTHHFMEIAHNNKEFEIKHIFINKNKKANCFKLLKKVKTPLFTEDSATYYLHAVKRFYKGWNVSIYDSMDIEELRDRAVVYKYSDFTGLGVPQDIIDSLLHDDGMSCLVIGTPTSNTELNEYNSVVSFNFDAAYYYLTQQKIKEYFKKHKKSASYESQFHGPVYGFPEVLFSGLDPFQ